MHSRLAIGLTNTFSVLAFGPSVRWTTGQRAAKMITRARARLAVFAFTPLARMVASMQHRNLLHQSAKLKGQKGLSSGLRTNQTALRQVIDLCVLVPVREDVRDGLLGGKHDSDSLGDLHDLGLVLDLHVRVIEESNATQTRADRRYEARWVLKRTRCKLNLFVRPIAIDHLLQLFELVGRRGCCFELA